MDMPGYSLHSANSGANVFNQYAEVDPEFDIPARTGLRDNLIAYLDIFKDAKYILVGEAELLRLPLLRYSLHERELIMGKPLPWAKERLKKTALSPSR
jgi:hypothetical protein